MTTLYQRILDSVSRSSDRENVHLRPHGGIISITKVAILSCFLGVIIGATTFSTWSREATISPTQQPSFKSNPLPGIDIHTINLAFTYNRTFGADPRADNGTEKVWESIVPLGQGSVRYPPESPQVYTLSVVHQLHCLWSIHRNYYLALHTDPTDNDASTAPHMRHCFDYLRQSLTCAADATLEPVDPVLGGVTGWGTPRSCRNYNELVEWAEKHRVNNLRGFLEQHEAH